MPFFPCQQQCVDEATKILHSHNKVTIVSPTGSAKTQMATQIAANTIRKNDPEFTRFSVTVPRIRLAEQWMKDHIEDKLSTLHSNNKNTFTNKKLAICQIHSGNSHTGKIMLSPNKGMISPLPRITSVYDYKDFESTSKQNGYSGILSVNVVNSAPILKAISDEKKQQVSIIDETHTILSEKRLKDLGMYNEDEIKDSDVDCMLNTIADKMIFSTAEKRISKDPNGLGMNNESLFGPMVEVSSLSGFREKIIVPPHLGFIKTNHIIADSRSYIDLYNKIFDAQKRWWSSNYNMPACPIVHHENSDQIQWITEGIQKGLIPKNEYEYFTMSSRDGFYINGDEVGNVEYMIRLKERATDGLPFSLNHIDMVAEGINIPQINCGTFMSWNPDNPTGNNNRIGRGQRSLENEIGIDFDQRKKPKNLISVVLNGLEKNSIKESVRSLARAICQGEDIFQYVSLQKTTNKGETEFDSENNIY